MKKVLILGGSGFIGINLSKFMSEMNYDVYSFDLRNPERCVPKVHYVIGDFFNDDDLREVIQDKDYIIHAISTLNPGNSNDCYVRGYEKDFLQTVKLCEMIIGSKTRLIFLSSGGTVYGQHANQPITEDVLPKPINHYGNIKLCMENTIRTFNYQRHIKTLIVRISNPYGVGQDFEKGVGFIDAVLKNSLSNTPITVWGDGENIRDYIYINDVCSMIINLLQYKGEYDTFNISSGIGVSQNQIIRLAEKMGLCPRVDYREGRSVDVRSIILDNHRIMNIYNNDILTIDKGMETYYKYLCNEFKLR